MQQDTIQSFLDRPEVLGVALTQGRIVPYFYVKENFSSPEKRLEFIRYFRNIFLENESISNHSEFQIDSYCVYSYRINHFLTLLIISFQDSLHIKSIIDDILTSNSQEDLERIIKSFQDLTKKTFRTINLDPSLIASRKESSTISIDETLEEDYSIEELVETLNILSKTVSCYLGPKITSNFWQLTRPKHEWINNFSVKSNAEIEFIGSPQKYISPLQHLLVREWTNKFIKECFKIFRDLPRLIESQFENKKNRKIISILPNGYLNEIEYLYAQDNSLFK